MPSEQRTEIRAKRILKRLLILLSILASLAASAQAVRTEIIELGYISAAEIRPVLKPLVPAPGSVNGIYTTLAVNSMPDNLEDILAVIQNLDRTARRVGPARRSRQLWRSPSHRNALLDSRLRRLGAQSDDGAGGASSTIAGPQ